MKRLRLKASEYVLVGEPAYTYGTPQVPEGAWFTVEALTEMMFVSYEGGALTIDCPRDAPTLADYISGDATTMDSFCTPGTAFWASREYGTLEVIQISIRGGWGGAWGGVLGYADTINLNSRTFSEP